VKVSVFDAFTAETSAVGQAERVAELGRTSLAAVLVTDIVGSTARDQRLGPPKADALRVHHFAEVGAIVERHGGRVVKSLGDGQLAVFPSPSASIDAAVEVQQHCAERARAVADPLWLRTGISAGEVRFDDHGDSHGRPVVEAARLCAIAAAGQIVVSEVARQLSLASPHPVRALGPLSLKGIDGEVLAHEVEWRPPVAGGRLDMARIDDDPDLRDRAASMLDQIGGDPHMRRVRARVVELLELRPGQSVLDVGCGAGDDVFLLAELVGASGRAVGIDVSQSLIGEARRRVEQAGVRAEFVHSDAANLDLPDAAFDAVRSDRVFQYLLEPRAVLAEIRRVTKPGGRVVIAETDWETAVFDAPDDATARINEAWTASRPNGRAGQQLHRLCKEAGLIDVSVEGIVQVKTELDPLYRDGVLPALARTAVDAGAVTRQEASRWLASLEVAADRGVFLRAFTTFVVAARVP
jgi:ubiquinone/menaquinone biosynthesis C-methylase UbiE/class 3 adenylate cyclase